jgi:hypothetical protein
VLPGELSIPDLVAFNNRFGENNGYIFSALSFERWLAMVGS